MISVCMTTYNGQNFLIEQINSILAQLSFEDELIICDDCSTDKTLDILATFIDKRIFVYKNTKQLGHVKNFEKCISLSKGDIIFLSDQDDIWHKDKISICNQLFMDNHNLLLLHHGIRTIDVNGKDIKRNFFVHSGTQSKLGLFTILKYTFKPRFFGCAMAFKKELLDVALPFPKYVYAHDHYLCNVGLMHRSVMEIDSELIFYRQHSNNLTPKKVNVNFDLLSRRIKLVMINFIIILRLLYVQR
jgi:glycosyltransferase involved in cell wall biosynthesis